MTPAMLTLALALSAALNAPLPSDTAGNLKDSLRLHALRVVNRERAAAGLHPVSLDAHTSALADEYSDAQLRGGFTGHFDPAGTAPYMRYPSKGTRDMLRENVASWSANYPFDQTALPDLISRSHRTMIEERPPADGHRRAILDEYATHMGFGIAWNRGEMRFTQLFMRRYVDWLSPVPAAVPLEAGSVRIEGRPYRGVRVAAISVHWEPLPQPLSRSVIAARDDYSLPPQRSDYRPATRRPHSPLAAASDRGIGELRAGTGGSFIFDAPLDRGEGVYTIVTWVERNGSEPFAAGLVSVRALNASSARVTAAP